MVWHEVFSSMYNSFLFFLGWLDCLSFWTCSYSSVLSFFVFILSTHLNKSLQKPLCGVKSLMCFCVCCYLSNRMTSEWSLSSKGRRGEALNEFTAAVWCSWHISLSVSEGFYSSHGRSSWMTWRQRLKWHLVRQWTFTTPTMRWVTKRQQPPEPQGLS